MATKKKRSTRNSKILPKCVCCGRLASEFVHINCIIDYLTKNDYIVFDLNLRRVFGFKNSHNDVIDLGAKE